MDSGKTQLGLSETETVALAIYRSQEEVRYGIKTIS